MTGEREQTTRFYVQWLRDGKPLCPDGVSTRWLGQNEYAHLVKSSYFEDALPFGNHADAVGMATQCYRSCVEGVDYRVVMVTTIKEVVKP